MTLTLPFIKGAIRIDRQVVLLAVTRILVLAVAAALAACSTSAPQPPRCDGSAKRAINSTNPAVASLPASKSCSATASTLGSRDTG